MSLKPGEEIPDNNTIKKDSLFQWKMFFVSLETEITNGLFKSKTVFTIWINELLI